jgi:hypothetical protein
MEDAIELAHIFHVWKTPRARPGELAEQEVQATGHTPTTLSLPILREGKANPLPAVWAWVSKKNTWKAGEYIFFQVGRLETCPQRQQSILLPTSNITTHP